VLLLAGCGGGHKMSNDERAAAATLQSYLTAFAHRDYAGACARLTDDAKERIARRSRAPTLQLNEAGCPNQLAGLMSHVPLNQRNAVLGVVADAEVESVEIDGDVATAKVKATFRGHSETQPVSLTRVAGVWKVDATPNAKQD
jgi:Putative lumazine-binding